LPVDLCDRVEERFRHRFRDLEELLTFVLEELMRDEASAMDLADERMLENRLRDLGYL
jgi:hypothetical protein